MAIEACFTNHDDPDLCRPLDVDDDTTSVVKYMKVSESDSIKFPPKNDIKKCLPQKRTPSSILIANCLQGADYHEPLKALFDSGSDTSFIQRCCLPDNITCDDVAHSVTGITGTASLSQAVTLSEMLLPEFSRSMRIITDLKVTIINNMSKFDVILGRDFCSSIGIDVLHSSQEVVWRHSDGTMVHSIPFRSNDFGSTAFNLQTACFDAISFTDKSDEQTLFNPALDLRQYDTDAIAAQQIHLSSSQRDELAQVMRQFPRLFSGELGYYPHRKIHLDLVPDARPVHRHPYPVPHSSLLQFKETLQMLVRLNVLERCGASEWGLPAFVIPKKDGSVRWIADFHELNKVIKRRIYPLPRIADILRKRSGYQYFSKLDIMSQFYTFELDDESKQVCVIVTPFGKYCYNRLPMGLKQSPNVAQEIMEDILHDIKECDCYIDDVGVFDSSWTAHLQTLTRILKRLNDNGFTIRLEKCEWGVRETDWLGYWLTPNGLKPWRKKIEAILRLERPRTTTQVRAFLGAVTYYRDMFPQRSHILAPLTELTGKGRFIWTDRHQHAFDAMKALIAQDVLVRYPDHNIPFHVYTDASDDTKHSRMAYKTELLV
jgi:hypothetical protein